MRPDVTPAHDDNAFAADKLTVIGPSVNDCPLTTVMPPVTVPRASSRVVVVSTAAQWLTVPLVLTNPSVMVTDMLERPLGEPALGEANAAPRVKVFDPRA
jgi:hypothetical protein